MLLAGPSATTADDFNIGAANGSFETGLGGAVTSGDVRLVTSFGALLPTEGSRAIVMTTEPDAGATQADASTSTIQFQNFTIPAGAGTLRLDYAFLTDELNPSLTNDRFRVKLILITAGGEQILLTSDTFGQFYPAPWTGYARQTSYRSLEADISAHAGSADQFTLELRVEDIGDGRSNSAVFVDNLRFGDAGAPVARINVEYAEANASDSIAFDASGSTDDGAIVSYLWDFGNGLLGAGQALSVPYNQPGIYQVRLTVTDDTGLTDTAHAMIVIGGENRGPTITTTAPLTARVGGTYRYDVDATDPETPFGDVLTYALQTGAPAAMSIDAVTGLINWKPVSSDAGAHVVTVQVTDSLGLFDTQTFTVTVDNSTFVIASDDAARLHYIKSNGDGTWSGYRRLIVDLGSNHRGGPAIADFDNDGDLDFIIGSISGGTNTYYLFKNDGNDTFLDRQKIGVGTSAGSHQMDLAQGDFNNDGNMDFVGNGNSQFMHIGIGDGKGNFTITTINVTFSAGRGMDTADFDHDGNLDILRSDSSARDHLLRGNGDGTFTDIGQVADTGNDSYGLTAGDFNNDGHPDFIGNNSSTGQATLMLGNGDLTFTNGGIIPEIDFNNHGGYDSYDFNGDGNLDLVASTWTGRQFRYYPGNGDGTFGAVVIISGSPAPANTMSMGAPQAPPPTGTPLAVIDPNPLVIARTAPADLSGARSSDLNDNGTPGTIVSYDWDFGDGTTDTGVNVSHNFPDAEAKYVVKLTVTDNDGRKAIAPAQVTVQGVPPIANAGGPYAIGEAAANAGIYTASLDGAGSSDADGPIASYKWGLGDGINETFSAGTVDPAVWVASAGTTVVSGAAQPLAGTGVWGARHLFSKQVFARQQGNSYRGRIRTSAGTNHIMWGLKNTNNNYNFTQLHHAIYFAGTNQVIIYENGASRGQFASFVQGQNYDVRIDVKNQGATYFFRQTGVPQWTVLFDTISQTASPFRVGVTIHTGTFGLDDFVAPENTSTQASPTHIYQTTGVYNLSLTVTDAAGQTDTDSTTLTIAAGAPPVANPAGPYLPGEALANCNKWTVAFNGAGSSDDSGRILSYQWNFGDGLTGTGVSPTHIYATGGAYNVSLTVTDHALQTNTAATTVTTTPGAAPVSNAGPNQTVDETVALNGLWTVNFNGNGSIDDTGFCDYAWTFGDGGTATGPTPTHKYANPGAYTATLTVRDHAHQSAQSQMTVTVNVNNPPVANAGPDQTVDENQATGGLWTVTFDATSSTDDFGISTYAWTFGDGSSATGPTPTHQYAAVGPYTATLTVTDHGKQTSTDTMLVTVAANAPPVAQITAPAVVPAGDVVDGLWPVTLNANLSTDDVNIFDYQWEFDAVTFDFSGPVLNGNLWDSQGATQTGGANSVVRITGAGSWTNRFIFSRFEAIQRRDGAVFQAQVRPVNTTGTQTAMWGLKNNLGSALNSHFSFNQMPHAIYFNNGNIHVYESGANRGVLGAYTRGTLYDIRITLKPAGAVYEFRAAGTANWTLLRNSTVGTTADMRAGGTVNQGTFEFDNVTVPGQTGTGPVYSTKIYAPGQRTVTLKVRDHALQSDTDTATIDFQVGQAPVANAGGPYQGGVGGPPVFFDGSGSTDDVLIANYFWDVDTAVDSNGDGVPDNDIDHVGRNVMHTYSALGTFTAKLSVVDTTGLSASQSVAVTIVADLPPRVITVPWISSDVTVPHETFNGKQVTLKGVVYDRDAVSYVWDFGDGTNSGVIPVPSGARGHLFLEAKHTYPNLPTGTPFVARLTVTDGMGATGSDTYNMIVRGASLETSVNVAIDEALWFMHKQQNAAGWFPDAPGDGSPHVSTTGTTVNAFAANTHLPEGDPGEDPYVETVRRGLDWMFTGLRTENIPVQQAGNPDTNGNDTGIRVNQANYPYQGGMVMDGIIASGSPLRYVNTGAAGIKGLSYFQVVQEMTDSYAYGQGEVNSSGRGSWRYGWNQGLDNSAAQWGAIGMIPAERNFGVTIPSFVKPENLTALARSQHSNGQFGYSGTGGVWGTAGTTPSGMVQLSFDGIPTTDNRWTRAENHMRGTIFKATGGNNWLLGPHFYGMFAFAKAMRLAVPKPITRFCEETACAAGGPLDWYADPAKGFAPRLVQVQRTDGSWAQQSSGFSSGGNWQQGFVTAWATLILTPALFEIAPVANAGPDRLWGVDVQIAFDGSGSFHPDPFRQIVSYEWDLDGDGVFDTNSASPTTTFTYTTAVYPLASLPQNISVTLRVTDNQGKTDTDTTVITIADPPHPPLAVITTPINCTAGIACTLVGTQSFDIDPTDFIEKYEWELSASGLPDFAEASGGVISHVFPTAGPINIGLRVTDSGKLIFGTPFDLDGDGKVDKGADGDPNNGTADADERLSDQVFVAVTIAGNLPPVADAGGPYSVIEGSVVALDGGASNDPNNDPITFGWDLDNDGVFDNGATAQINHSYPDNGVFTVGLQVADTLLTGQTTVQVVVTNAAPVVTAGSNAALVEGGSFALTPASFTDAGVLDTHSATIDWGDGSAVEAGIVTEANGSGTVAASGAHTYADNGNYTVTVTVTDNDGGIGTGTLLVTVSNAAPVVQAGADQSTPTNAQITLDPATFTDAGVLDTHTASIDWGDSTITVGAVTQGAGSGSVTASHSYAASGIHTVTVTVTDNDGGVGSGQFLVDVQSGLSQSIFDLTAHPKDSKIDLVWTPVSNATGYDVYRSTTAGGPYALQAANHQCTYCAYADFGLTNGTTYYYIVRSISALGTSLDSNEASGIPQAVVIRRR